MVACSSISWSLMQNNAFSVEKPYPFKSLFSKWLLNERIVVILQLRMAGGDGCRTGSDRVGQSQTGADRGRTGSDKIHSLVNLSAR